MLRCAVLRCAMLWRAVLCRTCTAQCTDVVFMPPPYAIECLTSHFHRLLHCTNAEPQPTQSQIEPNLCLMGTFLSFKSNTNITNNIDLDVHGLNSDTRSVGDTSVGPPHVVWPTILWTLSSLNCEGNVVLLPPSPSNGWG